jgi:hypothetical protein
LEETVNDTTQTLDHAEELEPHLPEPHEHTERWQQRIKWISISAAVIIILSFAFNRALRLFEHTSTPSNSQSLQGQWIDSEKLASLAILAAKDAPMLLTLGENGYTLRSHAGSNGVASGDLLCSSTMARVGSWELQCTNDNLLLVTVIQNAQLTALKLHRAR